MDSQSAELKLMSSSRHEGWREEFRMEGDTVEKVVIGQFCFRHCCSVNIIAEKTRSSMVLLARLSIAVGTCLP